MHRGRDAVGSDPNLAAAAFYCTTHEEQAGRDGGTITGLGDRDAQAAHREGAPGRGGVFVAREVSRGHLNGVRAWGEAGESGAGVGTERGEGPAVEPPGELEAAHRGEGVGSRPREGGGGLADVAAWAAQDCRLGRRVVDDEGVARGSRVARAIRSRGAQGVGAVGHVRSVPWCGGGEGLGGSGVGEGGEGPAIQGKAECGHPTTRIAGPRLKCHGLTDESATRRLRNRLRSCPLLLLQPW